MTFNTYTLALIVVVPMLAALAVLFVTKKRFGNVVGLLLGVLTLVLTAWAVVNFGFAS